MPLHLKLCCFHRPRRRIWFSARPLAPLLVLAAGLSSACGASVPRCHCTCPVAALPASAAPVALNTATGTTTVIAAEQGGAPVAEQSYASSSSGSAERTGPLSEQELLKRYEGVKAKQVLNGKATYYSNSLAGRKTASGERYDPKVFTAAHRKLPFGTIVRVVRTDTNRYVYVRITDRGPFAGKERIIDLSYIAAQRLGMIRAGVVPVRVEVLN